MRPLDLIGLALLTVVVRIPAYLSSKHLSFDDGTFASSVLAMRDGALPFRDVFSSQGPLFLPLAFVFDTLGLRTTDSPRMLAVVSGVVTVLAVYWAATQLTDRVGALLAGALAATSGSLMWVTGPLAADGPALAFATVTFALCLRLRNRPAHVTAVLLGLAVGATLSTKAMEAPILVPVVLVLLPPVWAALRRGALFGVELARAALAGIASLVVFVGISLPFGFADVWDQSFTYRTEASTGSDPLANAAKIVSTLWDRDLALLGFCAVTLVCAVLLRRRTGAARGAVVDHDVSWSRAEVAPDTSPAPPGSWQPSGRLLATSWVVVSFLWLAAVVSPLWRPHVSAMVPPLVLLVATYRPPLRLLAVAAVVAVPLVVLQLDGLLAPGDYRGTEAEVVEILRQLPDGAWVLSDEPGLSWRAGHRTTDDLVDPSMLRVQQGRYTEDSLFEAATDPRVCAVVVRSDERFGHFTGLGPRLEAEGYEIVLRSSSRAGDDQRVYVRQDCAPTAPSD